MIGCLAAIPKKTGGSPVFIPIIPNQSDSQCFVTRPRYPKADYVSQFDHGQMAYERGGDLPQVEARISRRAELH